MQFHHIDHPEPPPSKRGVLSTPVTPPDTFSVDWLTLSFPHGTSVEAVKSAVTNRPWLELPHGAKGYERCWGCGALRLAVTDRPDMGPCLRLSGTALRELGTDHFYGSTLRLWRHLILRFQAKTTRVDFAWDDYHGGIDLPQVEAQARQKLFTGRAQRAQIVWSQTRSEKPGLTVSFGSRASQRYCRFYDKAAEQKVDFPWVRVELEVKADTAEKVAAVVLQHNTDHAFSLPQLALGLLAPLLQLRETTEDTNRARRPLVAWWAAFVRAAKAYVPVTHLAPPTLERATAWLLKQAGPWLATIVLAEGQTDGTLDAILRSGANHLRSHHLLALADAQAPPATPEGPDTPRVFTPLGYAWDVA